MLSDTSGKLWRAATRGRAAGLLLGIAMVACSKGEVAAPVGYRTPVEALALGPNASNPEIVPINAHPNGKSYAEWTELSWQKFMATPADINPGVDGTGALCVFPEQSGPVRFIGSPVAVSDVTRQCPIPTGKKVLVAMYSYLNDYPCPDPEFKPGPGQTLEEFLAEGAAAAVDQVTRLAAELDGRPLRHLEDYRVQTSLFQFVGDSSLKPFDSCLLGDGQQQDAVADGYWLMLKPLSVGTHTLHLTAFIGSTLINDTTLQIIVEPDVAGDAE